ncbi:LPXTG cell wall anchor domain-containing protein [Glycomyces paridis]|uniref:LPXTG cell wall anchor domain-containing protein n=1 Tax=Glycomyces paridis TaxID=2126555 RepID=A0A4S8PCE6_9ACTN|nr:LPXTG cell wall anchor domain-containing protein [Glycomyces paridis]THV27987.1 LPXTG cell wall anchor domain-containing protein [Glycomyces paridis]
MSTPLTRFGRAPARFAAAAAAAALGAAAFAAPAAAQAPDPTDSYYDFSGPVTAGEGTRHGAFGLFFGDDLEPGAHTVAFSLVVDAHESTFAFEGFDERCEDFPGSNALNCAEEKADSAVFFDFDYSAAAGTEPGVYPYAVTIFVDDEEVDVVEGDIEVLPGEDQPSSAWPFLHGDAVFEGVEPGATVEVQPEFLQEHAFPEDAAAVIVTFSEPEYPFGDGKGAAARADYDNCVDRYFDSPGATCVVTDFTDAPGTVFTPTVPVHYDVNERAPGPVDVCVCYYSAYVVDAAELEARFGDVEWDPSGDLFGLRTVSEPESEFADSTVGEIVIRTADNPWDLTVADAKAKGAKGSEVKVTLSPGNGGPADAYDFFDGPGSYALFGTLPTGLALVDVAGEDWHCLAEADWDDYLPAEDPADLAKLDFACLIGELAADETKPLTATVKVTGSVAKADGTLEIVALDNDGYPGGLEGDPTNDTAVFSVDPSGSGQLPTTGGSMTMILVGAAAAIVAGVLLFVFTRRRRSAAEE